jgi:SAM-dependent methyltransferase
MAPDRTDPADSRRVPGALEAFWLAEARTATGRADDESALEALRPVLSALSDAFTSERGSTFADYGAVPAQRAAYALAYGSQAWVRTRLALHDAARVRGWARPPGRALRVLDLGAGVGAAGLSAASWLRTQSGSPDVELTAVDRSRGALGALVAASERALAAAERPTTRTLVADLARPDALALDGTFDLVVASFVLNELFPDADDPAAGAWVGAVARRLAPHGALLLLEPAPPAYARRLVALGADAVEREGLHAVAPQLVAGAWRPPDDARTWPHEVRRWRMPASLERLNRRLHRTWGELTYAAQLLARTPPASLPATRALWRMASPIRRLSGRLGWLGHAADGMLVEYEVQERDLAPPERASLLALERGDLVEARALRSLPHGVERLLGPSPLVRLVRPEGETHFDGG